MDGALIWSGLLGVLILAMMLKSAWDYFFPPRCEKCGRRYDHNAHEQCPYCVPLRRPSILSYAFPFCLALAMATIGLMLSDGAIVGCAVALFVATAIGTQLRIPWEETSGRVLLIGLLCVAIVLYFAALMIE